MEDNRITQKVIYDLSRHVQGLHLLILFSKDKKDPYEDMEGSFKVEESYWYVAQENSEHFDNGQVLRMLKGHYTNSQRFAENFLKNLCLLTVRETEEEKKLFDDDGKIITINLFNKDIAQWLWDNYDDDINYPRYTFEEALAMPNGGFKALAFQGVDINAAIERLGFVEGSESKTDGIPRKYPRYDREGNIVSWVDKTALYTLKQVNSSKIDGVTKDYYVLRCEDTVSWDQNYEKEVYLWVPDEHTRDPETGELDPIRAVASTFRVPENIMPYIQTIQRQGDILCAIPDTTKEGWDTVIPDGNTVRTVTREEYIEMMTYEG